ncbi:MAG: DUF3082 domain-containing protein [Nodosilinea sp.]
MADDSAASNSLTPTPIAKILQCFSGAFVAGTIAVLAYRLMISIAANFAAHPIVTDNQATANISAAVRTLVIGMAALGAGVFGLAGLGLFLLGIQLMVQRLMGRPAPQEEP